MVQTSTKMGPFSSGRHRPFLLFVLLVIVSGFAYTHWNLSRTNTELTDAVNNLQQKLNFVTAKKLSLDKRTSTLTSKLVELDQLRRTSDKTCEEEKNTLEKKNELLEKESTTHSNENAEQQQKIVKLEDSIEKYKKQIHILKENTSSTVDTVKSLHGKAQSALKELKTIKDKCSEVSKKNEELVAEYDTLKNQYLNLMEERKECQNNITALQKFLVSKEIEDAKQERLKSTESPKSTTEQTEEIKKEYKKTPKDSSEPGSDSIVYTDDKHMKNQKDADKETVAVHEDEEYEKDTDKLGQVDPKKDSESVTILKEGKKDEGTKTYDSEVLHSHTNESRHEKEGQDTKGHYEKDDQKNEETVNEDNKDLETDDEQKNDTEIQPTSKGDDQNIQDGQNKEETVYEGDKGHAANDEEQGNDKIIKPTTEENDQNEPDDQKKEDTADEGDKDRAANDDEENDEIKRPTTSENTEDPDEEANDSEVGPTRSESEQGKDEGNDGFHEANDENPDTAQPALDSDDDNEFDMDEENQSESPMQDDNNDDDAGNAK